jgi:hypothetical protein
VKDFTKRHWAALILIPALTVIHLLGAASVPFHPDESSLLYESRDFEIWLSHPLDLAWGPGAAADDPQGYRALNSPLAKDILGLGRRLAGFGPQTVGVDWDWTKDWAANVRAGALPNPRLLLGARLASTILIVLTLLFIYMSGLLVSGRWTALLAVGLVGTNAVVLLHTRRAMAEGTLLFGVSLAVWGIVAARRHPWLAGLGAALAFAAKQSAAPLALVGLIAATWPRGGNSSGIQWKQGLRFLVAAIVLTAVLQPFFWLHPIGAARAMLDARRSFVASQVELTRAVSPHSVLESPGDRTAAMLGELFIVPPQLAEAGNYLQQTAAQDRAYLASPWNQLFRGSFAGGILLALTLVGLIFSLWPRPDLSPGQVSGQRWLAAAGLLEVAALLWANPLPFQRYYIPLIPFVALWEALGLAGLARAADLIRHAGSAAVESVSQVAGEFATATGVTQARQGLGLDLANPLTRYPHFASHLFQCVALTVHQAIAQLQDSSFARWQIEQDLLQILAEQIMSHRIGRCRRLTVFHEIGQN